MKHKMSMFAALLIVTVLVLPAAVILACVVSALKRDPDYVYRTISGGKELVQDWKRMWRSRC